MKLIDEPRSAIELEKLTADEHVLLLARRNLLLAAHTLAQSLLTVGEPGMAKAVAELTSPSVYAEIADVATALAVHEPSCGCVCEVDKFYPNPPHWRGDKEPAKKYLELKRCWCDACDAMVTAYKCSFCGHLMHTTGDPQMLLLDTTEQQVLHA